MHFLYMRRFSRTGIQIYLSKDFDIFFDDNVGSLQHISAAKGSVYKYFLKSNVIQYFVNVQLRHIIIDRNIC